MSQNASVKPILPNRQRIAREYCLAARTVEVKLISELEALGWTNIAMPAEVKDGDEFSLRYALKFMDDTSKRIATLERAKRRMIRMRNRMAQMDIICLEIEQLGQKLGIEPRF